MKPIFVLLVLLAFNLIGLSQNFSSLIAIVTDKENGNPISNATVIVKESGWTPKTTGADGVVFFNKSMPVGEINFIVNKDGYQSKEGAFNITTEEKSNTLNIRMTKNQEDKILLTGEILDENDKELKGATIELKYGDVIKTGISDASGNYSVELKINQATYGDNTLQIKIKYNECKKSETIDLTRKTVIYKNFKLDCSNVLTVVKKEIFEPIRNLNPKECEINNVGDFCFDNQLSIGVSIQMFPMNDQDPNFRELNFTDVQSGQTQCVYNLKAGVHGYKIWFSNGRVPLEAQFYVHKCKSQTFIIK